MTVSATGVFFDLVRWTVFALLCFGVASPLLQGCASDRAGKQKVTVLPLASHHKITNKLVKQFQKWSGTPYRMGGMDRNGVDCSGFVQVTYRQLFDIRLPRTTEKLALSGVKVAVANLQPGDLVMFKIDWKDNHVGIYLENNTFMHVSSTSGVMLSSLDEVYWMSHFWQARRILN